MYPTKSAYGEPETWTSVSPWCAAEVRSDADTLCRIELSSSLLADHSLTEYKEALDTLAIRDQTNKDAAGAPRVEVSGTLAGGVLRTSTRPTLNLLLLFRASV